MKQLILLVCIFTICFTVQSISVEEIVQQPEQSATCGLSGIVVDSEGKPLPGFKFSIHSSESNNGNRQLQFVVPAPKLEVRGEDGEWIELQGGNAQKGTPQRFLSVETDADGKFDAPNIIPGQIQIMPLPEVSNEPQEEHKAQNAQVAAHFPRHLMFGRGESGIKLVSIRLNKLTFFYPADQHRPFNNFRFGLKTNASIKDVKITVKKRMKIYAQVVYANGTPVANAEINLDMDVETGDIGTQGGSYGTDNFTDAKGYFIEYRDNAGYYTLSVEHRGFTGGAGPFVLTEDKEPEKLVIKLNGSPTVKKKPKEVSKEFDEDKARSIVQGLLGKRNARPHVKINPNVRRLEWKPEKIVWIINPANGHAYAKVSCENWYDAQQKAIKEGAHLVSINNEEEQFWVETIFRSSSFWIGLNDVEKEGVWQWDSGEPVTYTNWTTYNPFPDNLPDTEKDFVTMTFFEGGWQSSGENADTHWPTREAVIEKDGLISKVPNAEEDEEE